MFVWAVFVVHVHAVAVVVSCSFPREFWEVLSSVTIMTALLVSIAWYWLSIQFIFAKVSPLFSRALVMLARYHFRQHGGSEFSKCILWPLQGSSLAEPLFVEFVDEFFVGWPMADLRSCVVSNYGEYVLLALRPLLLLSQSRPALVCKRFVVSFGVGAG